MPKGKKHAIPTKSLPKNWRELGSQHFECSINKIEKVVYGLIENTDVLAYMVSLAEEHRVKKDELDNRIKALSK